MKAVAGAAQHDQRRRGEGAGLVGADVGEQAGALEAEQRARGQVGVAVIGVDLVGALVVFEGLLWATGGGLAGREQGEGHGEARVLLGDRGREQLERGRGGAHGVGVVAERVVGGGLALERLGAQQGGLTPLFTQICLQNRTQ